MFTTIQEVGLDLSLLAGFLLNALLTGIQLAQVMSLIANAIASECGWIQVYYVMSHLDCVLQLRDEE